MKKLNLKFLAFAIPGAQGIAMGSLKFSQFGPVVIGQILLTYIHTTYIFT